MYRVLPWPQMGAARGTARPGGPWPGGPWPDRGAATRPAWTPLIRVVVLVEAGQPGSQLLHGRLGLGEQVDELAQPFREPAQADLVIRAPVEEFLDAAVREVHRLRPRQGLVHQMLVLGLMGGRPARGGGGARPPRDPAGR